MSNYLKTIISMLLAVWAVGSAWTVQYVHRLGQENERLRIYNARQVRAKDPIGWAKRNGPDWKAVAVASDITAVPSKVLVSVWDFEKGPPGYELGNRGRTELFLRYLPPDQYQFSEAGRSLNQFLWEWLLTTPDGKLQLKRAIAYCGFRYGGPTDVERANWGISVYKGIIEK